MSGQTVRGDTLYPSKCPLTVSLSTAAQVTLMVVLFSSTTPTSIGASKGTERERERDTG